MDHDQSIIVDKMESDRCKSKQKIGFGDLLFWFVVKKVVFSPFLELCMQFFDCLKDLARGLE